MIDEQSSVADRARDVARDVETYRADQPVPGYYGVDPDYTQHNGKPAYRKLGGLESLRWTPRRMITGMPEKYTGLWTVWSAPTPSAETSEAAWKPWALAMSEAGWCWSSYWGRAEILAGQFQGTSDSKVTRSCLAQWTSDEDTPTPAGLEIRNMFYTSMYYGGGDHSDNGLPKMSVEVL